MLKNEKENNVISLEKVMESIKCKSICVHIGAIFIVLEKAWVCKYGDDGISIFNENHLGDGTGDIININLRDIRSLEESSCCKDIEYRGECLSGDFVIEVLHNKAS